MRFREHEMTEDEESIWNADRCLYLEEINENETTEIPEAEINQMFGGT